ncbi:MAG: Mur ligase family protein, partial [Lentisphaeria bacterium]
MPKNFSDYLAVLSELVQHSGGPLESIITGACCDSRQCQPGFIFCAMQGERQDGHQFIEQALNLGAAAVLSEKDVALPAGVSWVTVHNAYPAFARIAEFAADYPARSLKLLGITGTNGKTTSAYLLRDILTAAGLRTGMIGTVEYDLGGGRYRQADRTTPTPFQLQQLFVEMKKHGVEYAVLEVSSHALAQERLGNAQLDGAIFTNLTRDHLDYHGDFERYYQCKKKLFSELLLSGQPMVINADDPWGKRLLA